MALPAFATGAAFAGGGGVDGGGVEGGGTVAGGGAAGGGLAESPPPPPPQAARNALASATEDNLETMRARAAARSNDVHVIRDTPCC